MGSSSSFVVGLINTINSYFGFKLNKKISQKKYLYRKRSFERNCWFPRSSCCHLVDLIQLNLILMEILKLRQFFNMKDLKNFSKNLFIYYTDINRTAKYVASSYVKKLNKNKKNMYEILGHVKNQKILKSKKYDDFGSY